jgi:hypothetical protein
MLVCISKFITLMNAYHALQFIILYVQNSSDAKLKMNKKVVNLTVHSQDKHIIYLFIT